jgi:uracil-DNA glycosylase
MHNRPAAAYPDWQATDLAAEIRSCRICADRFAQSATAHFPRPVVWFAPTARLLIAGQAPGARVHASGRPFTDPSGDRLRGWTGLSDAEFYDQTRIAIVPMAFCFPGYDAKGDDLPPPPACQQQWRDRVMTALPAIRMVLAVGAVAQRWHLGPGDVTTRVTDWRSHAGQGIWPLPHPSWRNTGWLKRNPWFASDLLPELRHAIRTLMETAP